MSQANQPSTNPAASAALVLAAAQRSIRKAKLRLMMERNSMFFAFLLANLKLIVDHTRPTAATDGVHLWMNPDFTQAQDADRLLGLLLHEVMHVAYDHMGRCLSAELDPVIHNMAGDHRINLDLFSRGYRLPEGALADPKYRDWSTRRIYDDLLTQNAQPADNFIHDVILAPGTGDSDEDVSMEEHREKVVSNIIKATQQAEMAGEPGSVPSDIRRRVEELLNPKLPWQAILANHMDPYARDDYSWSRPNRRYLPDIYLPQIKSEALKQITSGFDVSASVSAKDLIQQVSEFKYIWDVFKPLSARVMSFDTEVHTDVLYEQGELIDDLELIGGGGTNVKPLIQSIRKDMPEVALIFTDGEFYMPDLSGLHTDLLWIIKGNAGFTAPYGTVIHFD